jgi:citrate synthase
MKPTWLSADEAARQLGVKRETLYAYVSRGLIRSTAKGGATRERLYAREDVERTRRRAEDRRDPSAIATHALSLGSPVLESRITLIENGRLYYRGLDAVQLSRTRSIAQIASFIWNVSLDSLPARARGSAPLGARTLPFLPRAQTMLATAAARDAAAFDLRTAAVAATGARILDLMTFAASGIAAKPDEEAIEARLVRGWKLDRRAGGVLRAAIILCADHELNVSTFTARCVASAGGSPYGAVIAGLSALEGVRHGGLTTRVESMLAAMRRERRGAEALGARLREGTPIDGFGHPLYADGDPRAQELFTLLERNYRRSAELAFTRSIADAGRSMLDAHPSLDFALASVSRVLGLPAGSGLVLFAIGRTIGWIGHAIEQYASGELIRPRARYTGESPERPADSNLTRRSAAVRRESVSRA